MTEKKSKSVKLTRDMRGIPVTSYQHPQDGKKWKHLCAERKQLADWLASYGDGDGSRIFPKIDTMLMSFDTWSRAKLFRRLAELRELGILKPEGRKGESGPRIRRLDPAALESYASEVSDRNSEVSNRKAEVSDSRAEVSRMRETHTVTRPPLQTVTQTDTKQDKQDSATATKNVAVAPAISKRVITPQELFHVFGEQFGFEEMDGILGWIVHAVMKRQRSKEPVLCAWAYYRRAIENFYLMDEGKQEGLKHEYSFCTMFNLKRRY